MTLLQWRSRRDSELVLWAATWCLYLMLVDAVNGGKWGAETWNYSLGAVMVGIIYLTTRTTKRDLPSLGRTISAILWMVFILLLFLITLVVMMKLQLIGWPPILQIGAAIDFAVVRGGVPRYIATRVEQAALVLPLALIAMVPAIWRVRRRNRVFGFHVSGVDWILGLALVALSIGSSFALHRIANDTNSTGYYPDTLWAIAMFPLQVVVNGAFEETLFRGYLLPQLGDLLRNKLAATFFAVAVFNLCHLPEFYMLDGLRAVWWHEVLQMIFPLNPFAFVMCYSYWRSRSVVPGILMHTYTTLWAYPWLS